MDFKEITVKDGKYLALRLPDAVLFKEQHTKFIDMFKSSGVKINETMRNSETFGDPTLGHSKEVLNDTTNNAILLPDTLMQVLNKDPEANIDDNLVYLVKPSGVYVTTYKEAQSIDFPRLTDKLQKTELDPQDFISQYAK